MLGNLGTGELVFFIIDIAIKIVYHLTIFSAAVLAIRFFLKQKK